jgi:hypothetical protein
MALAVGVDALADGSNRMGEVERSRFRSELLRQDIADTRPVVTLRPDSAAPGASFGGARLSPEERRALREQLRQNPIPFEARGQRRPR